ncbi:metallophosphoesterase family protein [Lactobacillus johnsonii]|uniref:metallophosphoesterase family protein n=1 Tax=Lactobacillus johnsonii TaxID=33959 RepID=UPI003D7748E6
MDLNIVNGGKPYFFRFDVAKEAGEIARITDYLKTRVSDNGKKVPIKWFDQGQAMDVHGMSPFIQGGVGHYIEDDNGEMLPSSDVVYREWYGTPADVTDDGVVYYTLEDQFFCKQGEFNGFFGLRDSQGNVLTSVNIVFQILGNDLRITKAKEFYIDELENLKRKFENDGNVAIQKFHDRCDQKTQQSEDALNNILRNLSTTDQAIKAVSLSAKAIQDQIDSQNIVTENRFSEVTKNLDKSITTKLSQISSTIPWLKNAQAIEETYPSGYSGAVIAADTMHKWLYYDGRWNDAGAYSETISKDGDIVAYLDDGKTLTWNPYSEKCELDLSDITTGLTIRGAVEVSFSKEDIYNTFNSSTYTQLKGNTVYGTSFALVYFFSTNQLGIINPAADTVTSDGKILFLHHFASINAGLLVDAQQTITDVQKIKTNLANNNYAYVAEQKDLDFDYWDAYCNLRFEGDWVEVWANKKLYDVKVADIISAAKKSQIMTVTADNVLQAGQFILYFNPESQTVGFAANKDGVPDGSVMLFTHQYNSYNVGPLVDYHIYRQFLTEQKKKADEQKAKSKKIDGVPEYFLDNLNAGIDRVNHNMGEAGANSLSFLFITDMHWGGNLKNSPALVRQVMKKTGLPLMISGGDLFDQGEKDAMMQQATEAIGAIKQPGIFMANVFGNHDDNWNSWGGQHDHPERKFSYSDIYGYEFAYMMRDKKLVDDFHYLNLGVDFSYTFATTDASGQVWRFICVDTGNMTTGFNINQNSFNRIIDLLKKSENEKIIFIAHIFSNNHAHTSFEQDLEKVVDARNSLGVCTLENQSSDTLDFSQSSNTSKIIACFGGHEHEDYSWTSPGGVPFILTDSDNAPRTETKDFGHDAGTIGEQCFDVVTINPNAKTIKNVRIGRGIDRSFQIK